MDTGRACSNSSSGIPAVQHLAPVIDQRKLLTSVSQSLGTTDKLTEKKSFMTYVRRENPTCISLCTCKVVHVSIALLLCGAEGKTAHFYTSAA